ncbi:hypothetical protein KIS4809_1594 [Bacillus sp. ZZV12-4809]|nr:hypothetical protein KIS4809_1594 [Bacillus sp. ZZV12-4809]
MSKWGKGCRRLGKGLKSIEHALIQAMETAYELLAPGAAIEVHVQH